jgi:hypothetical protein
LIFLVLVGIAMALSVAVFPSRVPPNFMKLDKGMNLKLLRYAGGILGVVYRPESRRRINP